MAEDATPPLPPDALPPDSDAPEIPCSTCGKNMPVERKELLGVTTCIACTRQKKKPKGIWDYPEGFHERNEGVGGLLILDDE